MRRRVGSHTPMLLAAVLYACGCGIGGGLLAQTQPKEKPEMKDAARRTSDAGKVFADAVAVWHMADANSADGKSPLKSHGEATLGVELAGPEREESLARGGDGKAADLQGGWLDAGQGGDGKLNLQGEAMTMLLRLRNPSGKWSAGELFCKHGGHDKLVYNLFISSDHIGFEYGAEGIAGLAGQASTPAALLSPKQWHDVIARYDGRGASYQRREVVLFVDGFVAARTAATGTLRRGNTQSVLIGRRAFKGLIDHAALWQRALSDDEIVTLSGGQEVMQRRREAYTRDIEAKIGREGLTLADQLRGARELRQRLWNDPHRPRYHLLPPDGFWNDINGTIYWKGRYHVFFLGRLAPDRDTILSGKDTLHAREIWLHSSSRDLVHWVHHPPALVPVFDGSMPRGLYSGDAVENAPVPTLIYHVPGQGTCISTAEDDELIRWKPLPQNPVIPSPKGPADYIVFDPCAWKEGDTYYALIGNKNRAPGFEGDCTSLFKSSDMVQWQYVGPFYKSDRRWTEEVEDCACPDFFPLGNKHMLLMHTHAPYGHAQYYIGRYENERFHPETHGRMSWPGGQLCAPETLRDDKGRRIFWGWIHEARPAANGWGSVATLPRVLSLGEDNTLRIEPAPELEMLRYNHRRRAGVSLAAGAEVNLDEVSGDCLELAVEIAPGDAQEVGLSVRRSPDGAEQTNIVCSPQAGTLKIELSRSSLDPQVRYPRYAGRFAETENVPESERFAREQVAPFQLRPNEPLRLRIFLDRSVLEVYANGRQCITQRIYPTRPDSVGVALFARGGAAKATAVEAWDISPTNSW